MRTGLHRPRPLDFSRGTAAAATSAGSDVVLPVYGAFGLLERCLRSLALHTDLAKNGLVLVLDGPDQAPAGELAARILPADAGLRVVLNPKRLGFVGSVNRGMQTSPRDVVLLNSDTEVGPRWLEQLRAAADSEPSAATVTPFCNDASLCSLPRAFEINLLPAGHDTLSFARLVERASVREYPRLPTGVGVCLYIKRAALDVLGPFDALTFGLGYGEENDFCFRALQAGFVHLLDDATFVYHAGHASFGRERGTLLKHAARALSRRYPAYLPTIAACMRADPAAAARARVVAALAPARSRPRAPERLLHVVHGWPPLAQGGTEEYARGLAQAQSVWRDVAVFARLSDRTRPAGEAVEYQDGGVRVRLVTNDFTQRDPLARNALRNAALDRDLERLLEAWQPQLVHVHHLAGHALSLLGSLRRRRLPILYQLQDWWAACARTSLLTREGQPCSGPTLERCAACFDLTRLRPAALTNRALHLTRRRLMRQALRHAHAIVAGSEAVLAMHRDLGLLPADVPVHVLRYGVDLGTGAPRAARQAGPLRFGCVGALMPHKGPHVAVEAFRTIAPELATLDLWGQATGAPDYARALETQAGPAVRFRGAFDRADKARLLGELDVLIAPALGLESFGLVVAEAAAMGVPVLASAAGALLERVAEGCGASFVPGDALELRGHVEQLVAHPKLLDEWRRRLPRPKSVAEHAEELEAIYAELLRRHARADA